MDYNKITQKYVNLGYPFNIVSQAVKRCPDPFDENLMFDTLIAIQRENQENQV